MEVSRRKFLISSVALVGASVAAPIAAKIPEGLLVPATERLDTRTTRLYQFVGYDLEGREFSLRILKAGHQVAEFHGSWEVNKLYKIEIIENVRKIMSGWKIVRAIYVESRTINVYDQANKLLASGDEAITEVYAIG